MIQLRREWGRFSNFSFRTPQRRISAYPARPSGWGADSTVDLQNAVIVAHSPLSFAHIIDDSRNTDMLAVYR